MIHVDDAARAVMLILKHGASGIFNIVDDEPATMREVLGVLAERRGAPPPHNVPRLIAQLIAGEYATFLMNDMRGATNNKANLDLGFKPKYRWRTAI